MHQVAPQFGPVNVNNPYAILRNGTLRKVFEAKRIGPDPLPIYTPPPRTFPPHEPGKVKEKFGGPDFARENQRVTRPPVRITRPPATRRTLATTAATNQVKQVKPPMIPNQNDLQAESDAENDDDPPDDDRAVEEILQSNGE
ncbi:unnamed protein product [Cylicostephanus goldi]|uniref:Uncharacterized protein n=1 Tax=Cylicostephanus goldi TaxID=71465 RepID=A0A3P6S997_CYLGO|nr:unnamed protein product [Cylicostephanus goldi]